MEDASKVINLGIILVMKPVHVSNSVCFLSEFHCCHWRYFPYILFYLLVENKLGVCLYTFLDEAHD